MILVNYELVHFLVLSYETISHMRVFSHLCFVFVCCMLPAGTYFVSEASFNIILCRMSNAISMVHFIAVVYIVFLCYNSTDNPQPFHLCILLWLL